MDDFRPLSELKPVDIVASAVNGSTWQLSGMTADCEQTGFADGNDICIKDDSDENDGALERSGSTEEPEVKLS